MGLNNNNNNDDDDNMNKNITNNNKMKRQLSNSQQHEQLKCPRCDSSNTKFCYYNNYNKAQPRHYCKACKRHWTKGGTLRTVLAGGGRRKNKRPKTANKIATAQQPRLGLPLGGGDVSNFSDPFYQMLPCLGPTMSLFQNDQIYPRFEYSNLGIFESNPCSISSNYESSNVYNFTGETGMNSSLSCSSSISDHHQNWEIPTNCNLGWNYLDEFVSDEADLTIPWDDHLQDYAEIMP